MATQPRSGRLEAAFPVLWSPSDIYGREMNSEEKAKDEAKYIVLKALDVKANDVTECSVAFRMVCFSEIAPYLHRRDP